MPHDLPPALELLYSSVGLTSGPKKPSLERAFKPMGYEYKGGSGAFTLRRRTPGNLTVELDLDVGTWSNNSTAMFRVHGLGFEEVLPLPVSTRAGAGQYPTGDAERWQKSWIIWRLWSASWIAALCWRWRKLRVLRRSGTNRKARLLAARARREQSRILRFLTVNLPHPDYTSGNIGACGKNI